MSARLGLNEMSYISWKDKTFTQVTSLLRKYQNTSTTTPNMYSAPPLKLYRREIASIDSKCNGSSRTSNRIHSFEIPGGYSISKTPGSHYGVESFLDSQLVKTKNQINESACNQSILSQNKCLSTQNNALRKVRSSGKIKQTFYSSTNQYLYNRKRTFEQNQFNYLKSGNPNAVAGSPAAAQNTYSNGGNVFNSTDNGKLLKCEVVYKPSNYKYSQNGAVGSSTRMERMKYDALTTMSASYKGAYGVAIESSFAYGVPSIGYNKKDIIGFSLKKVPVIMPDGTVRKCEHLRIRR